MGTSDWEWRSPGRRGGSGRGARSALHAAPRPPGWPPSAAGASRGSPLMIPGARGRLRAPQPPPIATSKKRLVFFFNKVKPGRGPASDFDSQAQRRKSQFEAPCQRPAKTLFDQPRRTRLRKKKLR